MVIIFSIYQIMVPSEVDPNWSMGVSIACILWCGCYFFCSYGQFRTPYLFTSAYIVPLCIFHLGITVPYAFGWLKADDWSYGTLVPWLQRAGWYVALTLGSIGLGFALSLKRSNFRKDRFTVAPDVARHTSAIVFWDGLGLLAASAIFLAMAIYTFGNLLNYSRVDFFRGVGDTRGLGVFMMVFPASVILLVIGARSRFEKTIAVGTAIFAFIFFLLSGYRSAAFFPVLVGVVLWVKSGRKIPLSFAASAVFFVLIAIPAVGMLRAMGPYDKINKKDIETSVKHATIEDTFLELGQTAGLLAHVLRLIPAKEPYRYGTTYLHALRDSIPNIMPHMQQSERAEAEKKSLSDPGAINNMIPSDWLTYRLRPDKFAVGEGVGFTGIGEPYMNFGLPGVIVFFTLLGFILGKLDSANLRARPNLMVLATITVWPLLPLVRNDFGNFTKPVIFMLIILGIWRFSTSFITQRPPSRSGSRSSQVH
ncbi:MAG: O-antigen polysaccharide polymerase Wzy [Acidiferrobacterales bacterium]